MPPTNYPAFQDVLISSEGGRLYRYKFNTNSLQCIFQDDNNETLMGLVRDGNNLYLGAKSRIFKFTFIPESKDCLAEPVKVAHFFNKSPDFHQINLIDGALYATATARNEIWKLDLELNLENIVRIRPPKRFLPIKYKQNYNHLNNIFFHNGLLYICLNWLTSKQYGSSGFAVLDKDFREIRRIKYGWEAHNFSIIGGKYFVLCGSSGALKKIRHKHKSGLMIDDELIFEHDPNLWFCKDFSVDDNYVLIVGSGVKTREQRHSSSGVIFLLSRNYDVLSVIKFPERGGFCGCLFMDKDLTKNMYKVNIPLSNAA